jgi:hypothetical protein
MTAIAHAGAGDDAVVVLRTVQSAGYVNERVDCPSGSRALSGGVGFLGVELSGVHMVVSAPYNAGGRATDGGIPTTWSIEQPTGANNFPEGVAAVCSASSDAIVRTKTVDGPLQQTVVETVACDPGERAIGGGMVWGGLNATWNAAIQATGPVDASGEWSSTDDGDVPVGWRTSLRSESTGTHPYLVSAVCSASSQATVQAETKTVNHTGMDSIIAECPSGTRALSGGLGVVGFSQGLIGYSTPNTRTGDPVMTNGAPVSAWSVNFQNLSGASQGYKGYVVCEGPTPATPDPPTPPGGGDPPGGSDPPGGDDPPGGGTTPGTCKGRTATITGTTGDDTLAGTDGADVIAALGGNDSVKGAGGDDLVCGGSGADVLKGGAGNDRLVGQTGKDILSGGGGAGDTCNGGPGRDRAKGSCEKGSS